MMLAHGTESTYNNTKCRCGDCRKAHSTYTIAARKRRAKKVGSRVDLTHGKPTTYVNHGCRCRPCLDAWTQYRRDLRARTQPV